MITPVWCWISSAAGPSTRRTRVAGSGSSPSRVRGHCSFMGSAQAAISAPAISFQRVTSSVRANPCFLNASAMNSAVSSASLRVGRGLFAMRCSVRPDAMKVAAAAVRKKAGAQSNGDAPDPAALLAWYDRHQRRLPWRAPPGHRADPYHVWLSEIMLQQTTVKAVGPYYMKFLKLWPDVAALAKAPLDDVLKAWAGLGYYARARNLHACAVTVAGQHGGTFPDTEDGLRALPGVGSYTSAAIAAIAFDRRAVAIDGNIERVIARLYAIETELPAAKAEIRERAEV